MSNPKTFDNIDGTPIKVNDPPNSYLSQDDVRAETSFYAKCVDWRDLMNGVGNFSPGSHGPVDWFGHIGFYFCKDGRHGEGRAMDLNYVAWSGGASVDLFNQAHASGSLSVRRRYLSVDAACRAHFRWVLDGWYNADHRNHIHADDSTVPQFSTGSNSDVTFLQAVLVNLNGSAIAIDGVWGPNTAAAYANMKSKLGMTTDLWASSSAYRNWLTSVAVYGIANTAF